MNKRNLHPQRALRSVLLVLLLSATGMTKGFAQNYDFSAVCETGQTLYYNITDATNHFVEITYPGTSATNPWSGYTKPTGSITLPSTVTNNGVTYTVTIIGNYAFRGCNGLTGSLTIPNSVTKIGHYAFNSCYGLIGSLTIPNSVTSIGNDAFCSCNGLTSISIPSSVVDIGEDAFQGTSWYINQPNGIIYLDNCCLGYKFTQPIGPLNIHEGTRIIAGAAFLDCNGLTGTLTIPSSVTNIGSGAFENCSGFTGTLTIPNSVISIGEWAFYGCSGLTSISIPSSVVDIGSNAFRGTSWYNNQPNGIVYLDDCCLGYKGSQPTGPLIILEGTRIIAEGAFWGCNGLTGTLTIPSSVTSIGERALYGCSGFSGALTIPNSVISIGCGAFRNCSGFTSMSVLRETPPTIQYGQYGSPFEGWSYSIPVYVPCGSVSSYQSIAYWNYFTNYIEDCSYIIVASANPQEGGSIDGDGSYLEGETCTLEAIANANFVFLNWTDNGEVVSTSSIYSFTVTGERTLVANFGELTNYWIPEGDAFEGNMTLTCIVQLDGVEQATSMLEVGAFCGTQCRGSQRATYFAPSDHYIFQMIVFGESNDMISFRLYDHLTQQELMLTPPTPITFNSNGYGSLFNPYVLNFTSNVLISAEASPAGAGTITGAGEYPIGTEVTLTAVANMGYQFVNWMLDGEVVSTSPSYQFTVTEAADFVANFGCVHTQALNSGWNWWSTYIELTDNNGLSQLENSLGNAGILIKSRANGYVEAYQYNGTTNWYGTLTSINNEQMYKVRTNANCNAIISGSFALPESHPITINSGWNWIGFPCNLNVSVDVALSSFTPENNDVLKGRNGFTTYYSDENYSIWYGTLNTLEPGRGYMYRSNSTTQKTLIFQTGRGETTVENVTTENNIFQPADNDFADNMTITAVLELDGEELRSDDYELAAFVGDECRGSVKLMYVEPIDRYVAFLVVFGEPAEAMHFTVTDGMQTELSMEEIAFEADGMVGSLAEPKILSFGTTRVDENELSKVLVYPNPSNGVFNIQGQGVRKIEVFRRIGQNAG